MLCEKGDTISNNLFVFGQPGPRFNENLESIDGRKNRENKNHRNSPNGIANTDSKAARQERQGAWVTVHGGYFQSKRCICVAALVSPRPLSINAVSPAPPLNQCWGCELREDFPSGPGGSSSLECVKARRSNSAGPPRIGPNSFLRADKHLQK